MKFRHRNRQTEYEIDDIIYYAPGGTILHEGDIITIEVSGDSEHYKFQCSANRGAWPGGMLVLYYGTKDGELWARPALEFFDGRFERI